MPYDSIIPPSPLSVKAEDVQEFLEGLGLSMSVKEITEEDFEHMHVKRGHRRIIQRALGVNHMIPEIKSTMPNSSHIPVSFHNGTTTSILTETNQNLCPPEAEHHVATSGKTAYQFINCEKPLSAYVLFSNTVRESLKGKNLTFTEMLTQLDQFQYEEYRRYIERFKESQPNSVTAAYRSYPKYETSNRSPTTKYQYSPIDKTAQEMFWEETEADSYHEEFEQQSTHSSPNSTYSNINRLRFSSSGGSNGRGSPLSLAPPSCYSSQLSRSLSPPFHLPPPSPSTQTHRPTIPRLECLDEKLYIPNETQLSSTAGSLSLSSLSQRRL
ncbi:expressed protein [Phakopsora pachyrhizi]|uniref:Expressed protein n=1 Tax=Phakopsora pachyrhizi TaxID=170000 RepID=A0AAV0AGS9_PHAPC|nr:expressed protein [Phakopsora pachyrhizi]